MGKKKGGRTRTRKRAPGDEAAAGQGSESDVPVQHDSDNRSFSNSTTTPEPGSLSGQINKFVIPMQPAALLAALAAEPQGTCQRALRDRRVRLIQLDREGKLSLEHIREHGEFLCGLQKKLSARGEALQTRAKVVSAMLARCKVRNRVEQLAAEMDQLHKSEACYNEDVAAFNSDREWFFTSNSFRAALEHVEQNFVRFGPADSTVYLHKRELEEDGQVDFESLLQETKDDLAFNLPHPPH
eukprot:TRINITY_DN13424_c0_g1_i2.p1 TRINITY_DN13424_c0_g1~~TRINITY_DN13424_c0_g1_i2.p1  ORF type:complete len:241 (-),score=36.17 TRINITY_DN13424_c0_g1_i2:136-858(-)